MKLYIVRHGETDANANGIVQGWLDTELNSNGLAQATAAAANAFTKDIDAIYSSDLKRATQTALAFRKKYPAVPYIESALLRERNFGDATNTKRDTYDWELFQSSAEVTIPGAERLSDFTARVKEFLDELKTKPYSAVLVVAHNGSLNRIHTVLDPAHQRRKYTNAEILEVEL